MLDFLYVYADPSKRGAVHVRSKFLVGKPKDVMFRGHAFYAIWDESAGMWVRDEGLVPSIIDRDILNESEKLRGRFADNVVWDVDLMSDYSSGLWESFLRYCKSSGDNYHDLDSGVTFLNDQIKKEDFISKRLPYSLSDGHTEAYDELMGTLYPEEERQKLEWAIGAVLSGDGSKIQKFVALYGDPGTGKSTALNIIQKIFDGYWKTFKSGDLVGTRNMFALESLSSNPLVAIDHEGKLSKIEDNTLFNSLVSHEIIVVNEKYKAAYGTRFGTFIFIATNEPVQITDAKSGLIRRLIDVRPSGNKVPNNRYNKLVKQIDYELGAIAKHCIDIYKKLGRQYYDTYQPRSMMLETNVFLNFINDNIEFFTSENPDGVTLNSAWLRYKEYCSEAGVPYPLQKMRFKNELSNYYNALWERDGQQYNVFKGFKADKVLYGVKTPPEEQPPDNDIWLKFSEQESLFDKVFADCPAQYASTKETPTKKWSNVTSKLSDLDTTKLHYVKVPQNLIVIDFDIKDSEGKKSYEANLKAASKWPPTYAELSKSGAGIHLHYYYDGDVEMLSRIFDEDIEIKVSVGDSSLRRRLTMCNSIDIFTLSSGLPMKGAKKMLDKDQLTSERQLRSIIKKALRKEIHGHTKPEIDFIHYILEKAYDSGLKYDVRDLRNSIQLFALHSSNQAEYCLKTVSKMKFCSDEGSENTDKTGDEQPLIFFDVEVFPNLFLIVWKKQGANNFVEMYNPSPSEVEELTKMRLVGFNNRRYDNHMLYARMMGYTEQQLSDLSQRIINSENGRELLFGEAYNLSYTDIYDFMSAANKMSLKKWEIKLGIHHQELDIPFDKPVPEERWKEVAEYCRNDVAATEALFESKECQADWTAREMLALIAGMTVNDTTNQLTTRIILGRDRDAKKQFVYTDLSTIFPGYKYSAFGIPKEEYKPGAKIVNGKSIYRGEDPGEGGRVFATPGIFYNVPVLDIASMHPHSAIKLNVFGKYTERLQSLVEARVAIKHKDFDKAKNLLLDILSSPEKIKMLDIYLSDPAKAKAIANALKTAINSVYGLTSARFDNAMKDPRNVDNIVAKYGALFMMNLQAEVEARGFTVVHVKTDSIKIADATPEIIQFVMDYGKQYGYTFEHESTYRKICLVNEAVYIAQYESAEECQKRYGYVPENNQEEGLKWTATGAQFQVPYVFKTLFSKEPLKFEDMCETKSVTTSLYLDMNEKLGENHNYRFVGKVGQFCPIKPGFGGGILVRQDKDNESKFSAATGTKKKDDKDIYRWLESETVKQLGLEDVVDRSYYNAMVDDAIESISKYGDFEQFAYGDEPPRVGDWMNIPETDEDAIPFDDYVVKAA